MASLRLIQAENVVNGEVKSAVLPGAPQPEAGTTPGPDVIVGDIIGVAQPSGGVVGGFVGLGIGTTSCNYGVENLNWFAMPQTDHPAIPQNLYRMSGGADNAERFEQIGQSWVKHAFTALTENICSLGCNGTGGTHLGSGCSDPYVASLNYDQTRLGSRAWINPFTGEFPSTARDHSGHSHTGTSHRVLVATSDLIAAQNPGATYYAEGQYVTFHEYTWCNSHPGQCNMYNNVSYRRYNVSGTTSFTFAPVGTTQRTKAAITAWTGATLNQIEPAPGADGIGTVAYKVTNPSAGVWHYEYAVYNQNMDRAIQAFTVPLGCGIAVSNVGFHAPLNDPAWALDGTVNNAGISNAAWSTDQVVNSITWSSETFAQNPNANALRWGTVYNFRFDSNRPPTTTNATIGFFKTGAPITVQIQSPTPICTPLALASAVSRKTHTGAGVFDIDLSSGSGVESRAGDVSMVVTFSNNVVSGNATLMAGTATVGTPTFSGQTMTINLSGVTDQQKVTVALSNVTDEFSQTMPNTNVSVSMLLGDVNGSKTVNSTDVGQAKLAAGAPLDSTNFRADVNTSGGINTTDIAQVKSAVGHMAP